MKKLKKARGHDLAYVLDVLKFLRRRRGEFFHNKENRGLLEKLERLGLNMKEPKRAGVSAALAGKTFVLTGTLKGFTREEAGRMILDRGGRVASSVSKKTNALIAGEAAGSKLEEAGRLGVSVLNETEFKKLLGI